MNLCTDLADAIVATEYGCRNSNVTNAEIIIAMDHETYHELMNSENIHNYISMDNADYKFFGCTISLVRNNNFGYKVAVVSYEG